MNDLASTPGYPAQSMDFRQLARGLGTVINYAAGDTVFREGDEPAHAYIVLRGKVEVSSHGKLIEEVGEGRPFGVISLIDNKPRTATAKALEASEIALVTSKQFRYMIETPPNFVCYVLSEIVERLRATNSAL